MLHYDDEMHRKDVDSCLTLGYTQSDVAAARATWVFQAKQMGRFLNSEPKSKLLLVNGNSEATTFLSPLSFVCAKISDLVSVSNQVLSISYFCGRHTDELRDPRANAKGMLADLLGQLVKQVKSLDQGDFQVDLSSVTKEDCSAIRQCDLDMLFNLFRTVIMQLPDETVVFCLIDSISVYENSDRQKDTIGLMQKLSRLVRKSTHMTLKVMVTSPGRSIHAAQWDAFGGKEAQMLNVPENV